MLLAKQRFDVSNKTDRKTSVSDNIWYVFLYYKLGLGRMFPTIGLYLIFLMSAYSYRPYDP